MTQFPAELEWLREQPTSSCWETQGGSGTACSLRSWDALPAVPPWCWGGVEDPKGNWALSVCSPFPSTQEGRLHFQV